MRICLIYDCLFPWTVGGAERWYRNLAERLVADGHAVDYLTLRQWEKGDEPKIPGVRVVAVGPQLTLYGAGSGRRRIGPPLRFGCGVLLHLLRHGRSYDAVHTASFPYFSLLAAAAARPLHRFILVVDWFEYWSGSYWREYLGAVGGRIGMLVQRLCAAVPQRAFCFSETHGRRLRSPTILRGLYAGTARPAPAPSTPLVLFAGRLIAEKRAASLVPAILQASLRVPGLRGVILGDGPERQAVLAAIERSEAPIEAPGFVEDVDSHLAAASCVALPSIREGYGMIVIEAAARGVPSIVVRAPDNAATELVEDGVNGVICEPNGLAEAIVRVHQDGEALRASTRRWYAEHARELSLESSLERVLASYARK